MGWEGDSSLLLECLHKQSEKDWEKVREEKRNALKCTKGRIGLQSMGWLRVGHDWATSLSLFTFLHWRRKWQPTPVFLPGESQGRGSLVGCGLWGRTESDTTEVTQQQQQQQQHACQIWDRKPQAVQTEPCCRLLASPPGPLPGHRGISNAVRNEWLPLSPVSPSGSVLHICSPQCKQSNGWATEELSGQAPKCSSAVWVPTRRMRIMRVGTKGSTAGDSRTTACEAGPCHHRFVGEAQRSQTWHKSRHK